MKVNAARSHTIHGPTSIQCIQPHELFSKLGRLLDELKSSRRKTTIFCWMVSDFWPYFQSSLVFYWSILNADAQVRELIETDRVIFTNRLSLSGCTRAITSEVCLLWVRKQRQLLSNYRYNFVVWQKLCNHHCNCTRSFLGCSHKHHFRTDCPVPDCIHQCLPKQVGVYCKQKVHKT